jgi:hypothetical protein
MPFHADSAQLTRASLWLSYATSSQPEARYSVGLSLNTAELGNYDRVIRFLVADERAMLGRVAAHLPLNGSGVMTSSARDDSLLENLLQNGFMKSRDFQRGEKGRHRSYS